MTSIPLDLHQLLDQLQLPPQVAAAAVCIIVALLAANSPMFDSLLNYLWNSPHESSNRRHSRKSLLGPRTRAQQQSAQNGDSHSDASGIYPGLVNTSGTYCFLNSTLQVSQFCVDFNH